MRVLVIGGSGFIGRYVARRLGETQEHQVFGTFWSRAPFPGSALWYRVDLTDRTGLERVFHEARPDVVVHLAAMADVGACERDPANATAVNVDATETIARLCEVHGSRLVFVSSEYVFDGRQGFYREDDIPNPTTHYGRTKWEAEQLVASLASRWSVIRTSIVYGWPAEGRRNFVPWLIGRLRTGQSYVASTEVLRTPVYVEHLVDGISSLVETAHQGIHHVADRDWVSMYDFALAVAEGFGLDRSLVIREDCAKGQDTPTPDRLGLDCTSTMQALDLAQPALRDGIAAMLANPPSKCRE